MRACLILSVLPAHAEDGHGKAVKASPPSKPNIILIYSDCVGIGAVGCTGGPFQTPHIDSLAKGGMLFPSVLTGFIFTAGVSAQTPVSLLDGKLTFVLPGK